MLNHYCHKLIKLPLYNLNVMATQLFNDKTVQYLTQYVNIYNINATVTYSLKIRDILT